MLIFLAHNLAYLATPKTGSTAVEMALQRHADISFSGARKHITAQRYKAKVSPFLQDTFGVAPESVAVIRDPLDQLASWYRYRMRAEKDGAPQSTRGLSFDEFALAAISDNPPEFARVGSQFSFVTNGRGDVVADHLFAWDRQDRFLGFLSDRLGRPVSTEQRNVSPRVDTALSEDVESRLRTLRARDFALYEQLTAADGYLRCGPDHPDA